MHLSKNIKQLLKALIHPLITTAFYIIYILIIYEGPDISDLLTMGLLLGYLVLSGVLFGAIKCDVDRPILYDIISIASFNIFAYVAMLILNWVLRDKTFAVFGTAYALIMSMIGYSIIVMADLLICVAHYLKIKSKKLKKKEF